MNEYESCGRLEYGFWNKRINLGGRENRKNNNNCQREMIFDQKNYDNFIFHTNIVLCFYYNSNNTPRCQKMSLIYGHNQCLLISLILVAIVLVLF